MSTRSNVDFWTQYSNLCLKARVCPLKSVIKHLKGTELCCPVEAIRCEHWPFLLSALSVDNSLTKVYFGSDFSSAADPKEPWNKSKRRTGLNFPIPYGCTAKNISDICLCLSQLLPNSNVLTVLKIENLRLKKEDALTLGAALKNSCVEQFSLACCQLQDDVVEIICRSLHSSKIMWIDFSSCGLSTASMNSVCNLIKVHNIRRNCEIFPQTLRDRFPVLDEMKGLSRITLNDNNIGDKGVEMLADSFSDDVWFKAIDLQKCCIENEGAKSLLKAIKSNPCIELVDLRLNNIDKTITDRITLQLALNNAGKVLKFELGKLWQSLRSVKRFPKSKAYARTRISKYSPSKVRVPKRGPARISIQVINEKSVSTEDASSQTSGELFDELSRVKKSLADQTKVLECLHTLLKKYKFENRLLRKEVEKLAIPEDYIVVDPESFAEVQNTFERFKYFLDIMKEYGFWECLAYLGVNETADMFLKTSICDSTIKFQQFVINNSSSGKTSQTSKSAVKKPPPPTHQRHPHSYNRHTRECESKAKERKDRNESKFEGKNKALSEINRVKNSISSEKTLVQKVFKEVRENYTNSSNSSYPVKPTPQLSETPEHIREKKASKISAVKMSTSEAADILRQLKTSKKSFNTMLNDDAQYSVNRKTVSSQTSGTYLSNSYPDKPTGGSAVDVKADGKSGQSVKNNSVSSSKISTSGSSTLHKPSSTESGHSSACKLLPKDKPKFKSVPKKDNDIAPESQGNKKCISDSSRNNTNPSLSSKNPTQSGSEEKLKSSKISKAKTVSNKRSIHPGSRSSESTVSQSNHLSPETTVNKRKYESSSSGSSDSSYTSKNGEKEESIYNSSDKNDSGNSYLESVSEASTDKDVKSLSKSEVYSLEGSKKESKNSTDMSTAVKENDMQKEKHSGSSKNSIHSAGSKSSKKNILKKTTQASADKKPDKDISSDSSVPSLSDITTVSSRSLNTDSVMDQLSEK